MEGPYGSPGRGAALGSEQVPASPQQAGFGLESEARGTPQAIEMAGPAAFASPSAPYGLAQQQAVGLTGGSPSPSADAYGLQAEAASPSQYPAQGYVTEGGAYRVDTQPLPPLPTTTSVQLSPSMGPAGFTNVYSNPMGSPAAPTGPSSALLQATGLQAQQPVQSSFMDPYGLDAGMGAQQAPQPEMQAPDGLPRVGGQPSGSGTPYASAVPQDPLQHAPQEPPPQQNSNSPIMQPPQPQDGFAMADTVAPQLMYNDKTGLLTMPGAENEELATTGRYAEDPNTGEFVMLDERKVPWYRFLSRSKQTKSKGAGQQDWESKSTFKAITHFLTRWLGIIGLFSFGLLGGLAFISFMMVYGWTVDEWTSDVTSFLNYYSPIATKMSRAYYVLISVALVATSARYGMTTVTTVPQKARARWSKAFVWILLFVAYIITAFCTPMDDELKYSYDRIPAYAKLELSQDFKDRLSSWHFLNLVRVGLIFLAWLITAMTYQKHSILAQRPPPEIRARSYELHGNSDQPVR